MKISWYRDFFQKQQVCYLRNKHGTEMYLMVILLIAQLSTPMFKPNTQQSQILDSLCFFYLLSRNSSHFNNIFSNIQCIQITFYNSKIIERNEMRTAEKHSHYVPLFLQSCFSFSIFLNRIILSIEIQQLHTVDKIVVKYCNTKRKKRRRKRTHLNSLRP